ncbi:MAG: exodeoxyribonuclease VII large subunit [Christensenellaceae bacterium]|jgi:exodeoxyribonuclease VII large subunit|nr:exodeoxyribonuclease VII large subunit [Christensenellaceae bacterium]
MINEANEITVSQLNNYIKSVFVSEGMLHDILVIGEVTDYSGRNFFSLKDKDAVISCSCWDFDSALAVKGGGKVDFENGVTVKVRGSIEYWNKRGKINFNVYKIEKCGAGDLLEQLQKLIEKLKAEGLFDKKKEFPKAVKRLGVITSETGAVIQDIKNVTWRRNKTIDIYLYPAVVQGNYSQIIEGIKYFNERKNVDILIIARGGGSADDLNIFNSEELARAVAASKLFVVSAVGHETDTTLIDYVSDLRAPTPSAAAEMVVPELRTIEERILNVYKRLRLVFTGRYSFFTNQIEQYKNILHSGLVAVRKDGKIIKSVVGVRVDDDLIIKMIDGIIKVKVVKVDGAE